MGSNHSQQAAARVLVVDDEPAIRRSLAGILADEGWEAALAADGDEGLAAVRERAPDLVLLDIAMPRRDGVSVLEELRRTHPALPVVMMSGHGTIETAVKATQLGANQPIKLQGSVFISVRDADKRLAIALAQQIQALIDALDDHDDVQVVYANFEMSDATMAKLTA